MNNLYFLIISFIYLVLVMIIYFVKKKIKTKENKIFSILLVTSLIGIIIDFLSVYMAFNNIHTFIFRFINQLYLVYLLTWISLMTIYCIVISAKTNNTYILTKIIIILYIPMLIFLLLYPLDYTVNGNEFYTHGLSAKIMYMLSTIYVFIMIILLIKNLKDIRQKKYVPIIFYIVIASDY